MGLASYKTPVYSLQTEVIWYKWCRAKRNILHRNETLKKLKKKRNSMKLKEISTTSINEKTKEV
jgi:hypothetical protein